MTKIGNKLHRLIKKMSGRDAELFYVHPLNGASTLTFSNNFQLRKYEKMIKNLGYEHKVIYRRKEWLKWLIRIYWAIAITTLSIELVIGVDGFVIRLWDMALLVFYAVTFKTNVITMDY